jgi:hypothetical protein
MVVKIVENYLRKKGRCRDAEMLASALLVVLLSPGSEGSCFPSPSLME